MPFVIADRVRETTTTTGTGAVTLAGAYTSFQTFSAAIGNGNNTYYTIASAVSGEWEVGIGTYTSAGNTLSRDTVLASSNAGALVNFSSAVKDVFVTQPASRAIFVQNGGTGLQTSNSAFTANRVLYANAATTTATSANLTFDGTTLTAAGFSGPLNGTVGATTPNTGAFTTLSASSTVSGTGFTNYFASPPPIGSTAANTGSFTTLTTSSTVTLNGGTANGVLYLNGSKVATSGSALTFDGTNFATTGRSSGSTVSATTDFRLNNATFSRVAIGDGGGGWVGGYSITYSGGVVYSDLGSISGIYYTNGGNIQFYAGGSAAAGTAAPEAMRLNSSGNLGIGTTSPSGRLHISTASGNTDFYHNVTGAGTAARTTYTRGNTIQFYAGLGAWSGTDTYQIAGASGPLTTLDTSGNLGIGTTSPGYKLDVVDSGGNVLRLGNGAAQVGSFISGSLPYLGSISNSSLALMTNSVERARLDTSGQLGLGVTPRAWAGGYKSLDIAGPGAIASTASGNTFTQVAHGAWFDGTNWIYQYTGVGAARYQMTGPSGGGNHAWFVAPTGTASGTVSFTQAMTLDASGNLGIGTTSPANYANYRNLAISGTTGANIDMLSGSTKVGNLFNDGTNFYAYNVIAGSLVFGTNNTERMRLDSSGNLGLGVTPSAWGSGWRAVNIGLSGALAFTGSGANDLSLSTNSHNDGTNWIYKYTGDGAARYSLTSLTSQHRWFVAPTGTAGNIISFTQAMTLDASGNLGIGTTSPSRKFEVQGAPLSIGGAGTGVLVSIVNNSTAFNASPTSAISLWNRFNSGGSTFPSAALQAGKENATDGNYAGYMSFLTVDSVGTVNERMRLDSSGNLGLGTTSNALTHALTLYATGSTSRYMAVGNSNTGLNGTVFGIDGSGNTAINNTQNLAMLFLTNNTERVRIHAGGGMTVGSTQDDGVLTSVQTSATTVQFSLRDNTNTRRAIFLGNGNYGYQWSQTIYSNGGKAFIFANASNTEVGSIVVNSGGVAYNTTSDYRLKDNPQPLTGSGAFIDAIQPKTWTWKNTGEKGVGMIAHELAEISPSSVSGEKDGMRLDCVQDENGEHVEREVPAYQGVEYGSSELIANLIAEVQSLRRRVAQLESK